MNDKFLNLEIKNENLEKKLGEQAQQIQNVEKYIRRKNLIFFGIEEQEKSYHDLEKIIINIINKYFDLQYENNIEAGCQKTREKSGKLRPVIVTFSTLGLKLKIQQNQKCLQSHHII